MRLSELGEWATIKAIAERLGPPAPGWTGIGDDAAVTTVTPGMQVLTTVDLLVEDQHFRRRQIAPEDLGWKALAVNISDIAAMGGEPRWAVLGLSLPGELELEWLLRFYDGFAALAKATGCALVGGDTTGSSGLITVSVTVVGETPFALKRTGAKAGDRIFTTGHVGASAAGRWAMENPDRANTLDRGWLETLKQAHHRPVPQLEAGRITRQSGLRMTLLDDSDGLARSARLLAEANGLDVRLEPARFPIAPATRAVAAAAGVTATHWALFGGEDYNLVGTVAKSDWPALSAGLAGVHVPATVIGELSPGHGRVWVRDPDEQVHELVSEGEFMHFHSPKGP